MSDHLIAEANRHAMALTDERNHLVVELNLLREWQRETIQNEIAHHAERKDAIARAERAEAELAKERARFWWAVTHSEDFNQIVDALKWGPCRDKNTAITYAAIDAGHAGGRK
jgi:hypothetical protein